MSSQKKFSDKIPQIFGLFLSVIFILIGLWSARSLIYQLKTFVKTEGEVVEIVSSLGNKRKHMFAPKVMFAVNGKTIYFTEQVQSSNSFYDKGDKVQVLYNPFNPSEARINTWWRLYLLPFVFIITGGITGFLMVGILIGKISSRTE